MNICIGSTCQYRTVVLSEISFKVNLFHNYKKVICSKVEYYSCSDLLPVVVYAWFVGSRYYGHFINPQSLSAHTFSIKNLFLLFFTQNNFNISMHWKLYIKFVPGRMYKLSGYSIHVVLSFTNWNLFITLMLLTLCENLSMKIEGLTDSSCGSCLQFLKTASDQRN